MKNSTTCAHKANSFCLFAASLAIALTTSAMAVPAYAATFVVTTTADELDGGGPCTSSFLAAYQGGTGLSLREALCTTRDNADESNTVTLSAGTYTLSLSGNPLWAFNESGYGPVKHLVINGVDAASTIIQRSATPDTATQRIIMVTGGSLSINDMTIRHGHCTGGCFAQGGENSQDGGAILNKGTLNVNNIIFSNNATVTSGGAIGNHGSMTVTNSTFVSNSAYGFGNGGAIAAAGTVSHMVNNTFSANFTVSGYGGAIAASSLAYLTNNTLSGNYTSSGRGAGIHVFGTLNMSNNIIAHSSGSVDCMAEFAGTIGTNNNNLIGDGSCSAALSGNPNLGALSDNGGPTPTMALLKTPSFSPAIDAGNTGACPAFDQRGEVRPKGPGCDIGAFEANYTPVAADFFISTWQTDIPGQSGPISIILPMVGGPYGIDWDQDNVVDTTWPGGAVQLNFVSAGTYTIGIYGDFDAIRMGDFGDGLKLVAVNQWGSHQWQSMNAAFQGAVNMQVPASDVPDFSAVTDMSSMFENASLANPDTTGWDTGNVTTMKLMFSNALAADPDTSNWNVTSLQDASAMFSGVTLSTPNYDNLLVNWNAQALEVAVSLDAGNSVYCSAAAVAARDNMQYSHFWGISDGGECPSTFTIGGEVTGLTGSGLVLQNNAADPLPIAADGPFVFATALTEGSSYSVTVQHHPDDTNHYCSVTNGAGVVATADVGNVLVTCSIREEIILEDGFENPPDP